MPWDVEVTDEYEAWWNSLNESEQARIDAHVGLLEEHGPQLGYPHTSKIAGSKHDRMRELRVQHAGRPIRIFYAFDPRRVAMLLIGGDKTGDGRFYERMVPIADRLYDEHLATLEGRHG